MSPSACVGDRRLARHRRQAETTSARLRNVAPTDRLLRRLRSPPNRSATTVRGFGRDSIPEAVLIRQHVGQEAGGRAARRRGCGRIARQGLDERVDGFRMVGLNAAARRVGG
jgi:hypothetical protein